MNLKIGMLAKVKAGHDKNHIYVITAIDEDRISLADGNLKTVCHPKKKNRKHIQQITSIRCVAVTDDKIRAILKTLS